VLQKNVIVNVYALIRRVVVHGCTVYEPKDGVVAHGCAVYEPKDGNVSDELY